jgi:uncharacterized protein (TIGR02452 family)
MTDPSTQPTSRRAARLTAEETVRILESGVYTSASGRQVTLGPMLAAAVKGTVTYPPDPDRPVSQTGPHDTRVEVVNESTLAAARRLLAAGHSPVALNFASATHPGGGFLNGAQTQEEYLCRCSGLYACLRNNRMYEFHRSRHDPLYTDAVIYSPAVPVFRGDDGALLDELYAVAFVTAPAVNVGALHPVRHPEAEPAMWHRILKVLRTGLVHGHDAIVLGAWGCGAFRNAPGPVAELFRQALAENYRGAYRAVTFAVLDSSPEERFIGPFRDVFALGIGREQPAPPGAPPEASPSCG